MFSDPTTSAKVVKLTVAYVGPADRPDGCEHSVCNVSMPSGCVDYCHCHVFGPLLVKPVAGSENTHGGFPRLFNSALFDGCETLLPPCGSVWVQTEFVASTACVNYKLVDARLFVSEGGEGAGLALRRIFDLH